MQVDEYAMDMQKLALILKLDGSSKKGIDQRVGKSTECDTTNKLHFTQVLRTKSP